MDGIHLGVLVGLVEFHATGDTDIVFGSGKAVSDRLGILATALDDVCDQHDLVISVGIQVRRISAVFCLERCAEVFDCIAGFGRIELHDADIAQSGLSSLLFEAEWQPDRADLDGEHRPLLW